MKDGSALGILYRAEMRTILRDRRSVFASIVLPALVMPAILFSTTWGQARREVRSRETVHPFAVDRGVTGARRWIEATRVRLDTPGGGWNPSGLKLLEVESADAAASLERGEVRFYVREESAGERLAAREDVRPEGEEPLAGVPHLVVVYRADRASSGRAAAAFREALAATRRDQRQALLTERGLAIPGAQLVRVAERDVASAGDVAGLALGRGLTALLVLLVLSAGAVVATDSLAGEKERGTLETLLTTAASRAAIVGAKHLAILTVALAVTLVQTASFLATVALRLVPAPEGLAAALTPGRATLLLFLSLPVAALASAALLVVSGLASSYRDAQLAFVPLFLVGFVTALAPYLPGVPLRSALLLVPVANVAVAVKELLAGSADWPAMAAAWAVTGAAALLAGRGAARLLSAERLVLPPARRSSRRPSRAGQR